MRTTRFYQPHELSCGHTTNLDSNASSHLIRVLRTKKESPIILFNGDGFDYYCRTLDEHARKTLVQVETKQPVSRESNLSITLLQGLSRQDRMEITVQKSVELGVNRIIPVVSQRSNTKTTPDNELKKIAHWQNVAISACEQSGRCLIPEISGIKTLSAAVSCLQQQALKIVLNPEVTTSLKEIEYRSQPVEIFIGPEGGLNNEEIDFLQKNAFSSVRFGPRILRTETAGPAVISALQSLWGDC